MRKVIFFTCVALFAIFLAACNKDDIQVFSAKNQIYFDKFYMNALAPGNEEADTTRASFFFYPDGTQEIKVNLVVQLSGMTLTSDLTFGLKLFRKREQPGQKSLSWRKSTRFMLVRYRKAIKRFATRLR